MSTQQSLYSVSVCLSVRGDMSGTIHTSFTYFLSMLPMTARSASRYRRRCDTLCTSGFVDDIKAVI